MKKNLLIFFISLFVFISLAAGITIYLDPFFHYHAPLPGFFYTIDNERFQNNGIARYFKYDSILTGSSQIEPYKASTLDNCFDADFVKLPFSGATFYETGNVLKDAYETGHSLKLVIRSFDVNHIVEDACAVRDDLGDYPEHLHNDTFFDDYKYVLNIDIFHDYIIPMINRKLHSSVEGHTSFDDYAYNEPQPGDIQSGITEFGLSDHQTTLTNDDIMMLENNIDQNIISYAKKHPETTFYYFIPPYSIAWWNDQASAGTLDFTCEAVELAVEKMLPYDNIHIYFFANDTDLTTNLGNYQDLVHYTYPVSEFMLNEMVNDSHRLSSQNYKTELDHMHSFYRNYDYGSLRP